VDLAAGRWVDGGSVRSAAVDIAEFQATIAATYGERDADRGTAPTIAWLCEEVGELAQATRKGTPEQQLHELGDVIAWVASLAHQLGLSLDEAAQRYASGCPVCGELPCAC
jgi:NTP pyrophosphatase (non-canonical NTP hydrolase)